MLQQLQILNQSDETRSIVQFVLLDYATKGFIGIRVSALSTSDIPIYLEK